MVARFLLRMYFLNKFCRASGKKHPNFDSIAKKELMSELKFNDKIHDTVNLGRSHRFCKPNHYFMLVMHSPCVNR